MTITEVQGTFLDTPVGAVIQALRRSYDLGTAELAKRLDEIIASAGENPERELALFAVATLMGITMGVEECGPR
jgi:hypothetical protein